MVIVICSFIICMLFLFFLIYWLNVNNEYDYIKLILKFKLYKIIFFFWKFLLLIWWLEIFYDRIFDLILLCFGFSSFFISEISVRWWYV